MPGGERKKVEGADGAERLVNRPSDLVLGDGRADKPPMGRGVGARLREIRGRRPRKEFGAELNTHRNTIERYENESRPVDAAFLQLVIQKNPGWRLEWLLTGRGEKREPGAAPQPHQVAEPAPVPYGTIDDGLLATVMREIECAFGKNYERVSTEKRAALIAAVYDDARSRGAVSRDMVLRLVKLTGFA